jgi:hypothetical protein
MNTSIRLSDGKDPVWDEINLETQLHVDLRLESLLPSLVSQPLLGTTIWDIVITTIVFVIGELILSRVLFVLKIRDRPF